MYDCRMRSPRAGRREGGDGTGQDEVRARAGSNQGRSQMDLGICHVLWTRQYGIVLSSEGLGGDGCRYGLRNVSSARKLAQVHNSEAAGSQQATGRHVERPSNSPLPESTDLDSSVRRLQLGHACAWSARSRQSLLITQLG